MKAAFVKRKNAVSIKEIPTPTPQRAEVLLKIDACGVCGSDFIEAKVWARRWKRFGHEIVATVDTLGEKVTGFDIGDQVVVALSVPCGTCPACRLGNPRKCHNLITQEQGGFAEYLLIKDKRILQKVDPPLPVELACFAEPLTVILDAFHLAGLDQKDHFLVVGGGFLGKLSLLATKAFGTKTTGLLSRQAGPEIIKYLKETGSEHYAWHTIAGKTFAAPGKLRRALSRLSERVVVLNTAPARYIKHYIDLLPYDSTIINIGLSANPKENRLTLDASKLIFKRIQIMSAFPVPCLYLPQALAMLRKHSGLFSQLPTREIPLPRLPEVIASKRTPQRKILITF